MTTVHDQFVGVADESTYGAAAAPDKFFEILSESVNGSYERIESEAIRGAVLRADRYAPNPKGAAGDFEFEALDKGVFEFFLPYMFGNTSVTGDGETTPIEVEATPGDLAGTSFTMQVARFASVANSLVPFTYSGGKVAEWEISAEVDGIVKGKVTCDFATETINGSGVHALATPTYPAGAQLLTFIGGRVTVEGSDFAVSSVTLTGNNGLNVERYAMRGSQSTTKREPLEQDMKEYTLSLSGEFEDDAHSQRVAAALAAGALGAVSLHFDSPQGGALDITLPAVRWDEAPVNAAREISTQEITTKVLAPEDGSAPLTVNFASVL